MPSRLEAVLRAGEAQRCSVRTGANATEDFSDEALWAVLDRIVNGDPKEACRAAANWCALNKKHYRACREGGEMWATLTIRIFGPYAHPNLDSSGSAQKNFYELCSRAAAYRNRQRVIYQELWEANVKVFVIAAIGGAPYVGDYKEVAYFNASDALRRDPEVVLAAIEKGVRLHSLPTGLASDRDFMLKALEYRDVTRLASYDLEHDQDFLNEALRRHSSAITYWLPPRRDSSNDEMRDAMALNGLALGDNRMPRKFKDSVAIVTAAVGQNGLALEFATPKLKRNRQVVLRAIQQNALALNYMDRTFWTHDFLLEAVRANPLLLAALDQPWAMDPENNRSYMFMYHLFNKALEGVVYPVQDRQGHQILWSRHPNRLQLDFVVEVMKLDPMLMRGLPDRYKDRKGLALMVAKLNPQALQYASPRLQQDPEVLEVVRQRNAMRVRLPPVP